MVLIHGKKAGVMLRGEALGKWVEGGAAEGFRGEGSSGGGGGIETGVSIPAELGGADGEGMERCRRDME